MNGMYYVPVEANYTLQERGQMFAPSINYAYGPYTAPIPTILGTPPGLFAPRIPQAVPGGIHVVSQRNGADVFIGDVKPNIDYSAMKAPSIPTTGGSC